MGIIVSSILVLANLTIARGFVADVRFATDDEPVFALIVAATEAAASGAAGVVLFAGAVAIVLKSPRAPAMHRLYAWSKLLLTLVAFVTYGWLLADVWMNMEVRLLVCLVTAIGAIYPVFVLLGLRRARSENSTGAVS